MYISVLGAVGRWTRTFHISARRAVCVMVRMCRIKAAAGTSGVDCRSLGRVRSTRWPNMDDMVAVALKWCKIMRDLLRAFCDGGAANPQPPWRKSESPETKAAAIFKRRMQVFRFVASCFRKDKVAKKVGKLRINSEQLSGKKRFSGCLSFRFTDSLVLRSIKERFSLSEDHPIITRKLSRSHVPFR